jgi:hypothetical protein
MKKLLLAVFALALFASFSYAQHNADAVFNCKVIKALTVTQSGNQNVYDVEASQTRSWGVGSEPAITFTITGEPNYPINVTKTGPTVGGKLSGATVRWSNNDPNPIYLGLTSGVLSMDVLLTSISGGSVVGTGTVTVNLAAEYQY